jgi:phospholipid/cholesterol/gamma-HCH transport system substrate-binding protein
MTEQAKTILIGVFIIIACLSLIGVLLFLRPSVGDAGKRLYVCFTSIDKVQVGTRVTFAGKPVGEVVAIKEIYDARSQPTDRSGHVCFYELELAIDSHTVVYDTDEVVIHTTGLLGERTIAIIPKAVKKGQPSYPVTDQVLYGKSGDAVDEIINQLATIGSKANDMMDAVTKLVNKNEPDLNAMLKNVGAAANSLKVNLDHATEIDLLGTFKDAGTNVADAAKGIATTIHKFDENGTFNNVSTTAKNLADITTSLNDQEKLKKIMHNIHEFTEELASMKGKVGKAIELIGNAMPDVHATFKNTKEITAAINHSIACGKGTIGKLIKSDEFYVKMNVLMGKADTLMNDINSYGILFHQNKTWQRERLRRIARLYNLCTPADFRRYFEEEVNMINLALSRVATSMQRADEKFPSSPVTRQQLNCQFIQLLQRLDSLEETLKLYQQELQCQTGAR